MYRYKVRRLMRVVDGDTVDFEVDLGFRVLSYQRFRLLGVDTPELRGGTEESKKLAREAREFVLAELVDATSIEIQSHKADSFGRWLAEVSYTKDGQQYDLAFHLIAKGYGSPA